MLLAWLPPTPAHRPRPYRVLTSFALIVATVFGPACHDATGPGESLAPVPSFTVISGNGQTGVVGSELPVALVARATNSSGAALAGVTVFFVVTQGGGKLYAGGGVTNASGDVKDFWTLGPGVGTHKVEVRAVDPTTGAKNSYGTFTATATVGPASIIKVSAGDGQTAFTRAPLAVKPTVLVTDALGNPVANVSVTFAVTAGGGTIGSAPVITGPNGVGTLISNWRLGRAPGLNKITATKTGLLGSPVTFTATAKFGLKLVEPGLAHTCALSAANDVYCWGDNSRGEIGDGTNTNRLAPVRLSNTGLLPPSLAMGALHSCALLSTGKAYCWGLNNAGQLGDGTMTNSNVPVAVLGGLTFTSLVAQDVTTCGLTAVGEVWCWGYNVYGNFGNGTTDNSTVPVLAAGGRTFNSIHAGYLFMCGLTTAGRAWCWGDNRSGQFGNGATALENISPVEAGGGLTFTSLELGGYHSCGLIAGGKAYCWGNNAEGELGESTVIEYHTPQPVGGGFAFVNLAAGYQHTCGIIASGVAYCWGSNGAGELGGGVITTRSLTPALVAGGYHFASLSANPGGAHTCGVPLGGGTSLCWGHNGYGQLGNGGIYNIPLPVEVLVPPVP